MASALEVIGLDTQKQNIDRLISTNPDMETRLRSVVKRALLAARQTVENKARMVVGHGYPHSNGDPRAAYRAVRSAVYRRILGGNINILTDRRASGGGGDVSPQRRGLDKNGQRRGNHQPVGPLTQRMRGYGGKERGMILRWLNDGTQGRTSRYGNRGSIAGGGWFAGAAQSAIEEAAMEIDRRIEELIKEVDNG